MLKLNREEKKVEYLELIYDLIFVYIIGRNNSLLHHLEGGFISGGMFLTYLIVTLAVIQIWNFSTFYINRYGRNGLRDHIFLFVNMFLLYYMADGTRVNWQVLYNRYNAAWALILVNIGLQYVIEMRNHRPAPWELNQMKRAAGILFCEAAVIAVSFPVFHLTGVTLAPYAILFGMIATGLSGKKNDLVPVDFTHLSERAMLYVVFTFGEMIIAIASYFDEEISFNSVYFAGMAFLIVVGLFLTYGTLYDHILDREIETRGTGYMLIHVFLIFGLNNITTALEFMRDEHVDLMPKTLFLIASFLLYFTFLFMTERYAKQRMHFEKKLWLTIIISGGCFAVLMLLFRNNMYVNIAITVIFVFWIYYKIYRIGRAVRDERSGS